MTSHKRCILLILLIVGLRSITLADQQFALQKPFGMCLADDTIYIAEIDSSSIAVIDKKFQLLHRILEIPGYGSLSRPFDIAYHHDRFYILDTGHSNVVVTDAQFNFIYKIGSGSSGSAPSQFSEPHALAVTSDRLFVTDTANHRIQVFDKTGTFLQTWLGTDAGGIFPINTPSGIAALPDSQHLVIADYGNHPPIITDLQGSIIAELQSFGLAYGAFAGKNRILITYTYANTVAIYDLTGKLLFTITSPQDSSQIGLFNKPAQAILTSDGNILVSEWRNQRLQLFSNEGRFLAAYGGRAMNPGEQCIDFPKKPRKENNTPVILGAFTVVLTPDRINYYHEMGVTALAIQPYENLLDSNIKIAVDTAHTLNMTVELVFDAAWYGARPSPVNNTSNGKSPFANQNPHFYTLKRDGKTLNEEMLSYVYPDVRRFKVRAAVEAMQASGADTIALDYIRWPAGHSDGYDPPAITAFQNQYGISPFDIEPTDPRWVQWRANYVTEFICELRRELSKLDRDIAISVYVDADPEQSNRDVSRDWATWARMGIIDKINLMLYTDDYSAIYNGIRTARTLAERHNLTVSSTIDCYCGYLYTPQLLREGAWVSLLAGADEVIVCRDGAIERLGLFSAFQTIRQDFLDETQKKTTILRP